MTQPTQPAHGAHTTHGIPHGSTSLTPHVVVQGAAQALEVYPRVFGVKVTSVNTSNRHGKRKRTRAGWGRRPDTKRAIVSIAEGQRIDIFSGPLA